jgi:hypothetical protein
MTARGRTAWALVFFIALFVFYWLTYAYAHEWNQRWLRGEDRLIEWVTFAGFLGASLSLVGVTRRARPAAARAWMAGLVLFFFVCAGEEISWGQRVFGFGTPSDVSKVNEQDEFNLHNLKLEDISPLGIVSFFMKVFGIAAPLIAWNRRPRIVPPPVVASSFLFAEIVSALPKMLKGGLAERYGPTVALEFRLDSAEFKEMVWGVSCLLAALAIRSAWRKPCGPS